MCACHYCSTRVNDDACVYVRACGFVLCK